MSIFNKQECTPENTDYSRGLFARPDRGYGGSRDWYLEGVLCECKKCHCNNGNGFCVMPSKISLDINGRCIMAKLED